MVNLMVDKLKEKGLTVLKEPRRGGLAIWAFGQCPVGWRENGPVGCIK